MKLPKEVTTVTTFSKLFALSLFVILPFYGFYLGMVYQQTINGVIDLESTPQTIAVPHPTPTSLANVNWQTYRNSTYGIEIQYPADWKVFDDRPFGVTLLDNNSQLEFYVINPNIKLSDLARFERIQVGDKSINFYYYDAPPSQSIGAIGIYPASGKNSGSYKDSVAAIGFVIERNDRADKETATIKTILSTFKFLDQTSANDNGYTCPPVTSLQCITTGAINDEVPQCSAPYVQWVKTNCPNTKLIPR